MEMTMHHFFVPKEQITESEIMITGSDVNHMKNVLRMESGEQVCIRNGEDSSEYLCEIKEISGQQILLDILSVEEAGVELPAKIYLFQGLPKSDKMELIIQKAVELGVYEIIPVATKRSVVKLDAKKEQSKRKRWNAISESAAKQSKRAVIPEVKGVMNFAEALQYANDFEQKLIPYELESGMAGTKTALAKIEAGQSIAVFIGPEGGFSEQEIEAAKKFAVSPISLGKRILRTETAGLTTLSILMFYLESQ